MSTPIKIALAVDDSEIVLTSLRRLLSLKFDEVFTATTPSQAEEFLKAHLVTHLISDFNLGDGLPFGTDLVTRWRQSYPNIERAVIVSGSMREEIDPPPEVDAVLGKPVSMAELIEALAS